jgi:two-component system CheB/CheR fusion protein
VSASVWAAAAHDLRQPLQGVKLLARVLAEEPDGAARRQIGSRLEAAAASLQVMIDRLAEIAAAEAQSITLRMAPCDLHDLLSSIASDIRSLAESRGGSIAAAPCALTVVSEPRLLREVIRGLALHAFWIDPSAAVTLSARPEGPHTVIAVATAVQLSPSAAMPHMFTEMSMSAGADHTLVIGLGLRLVEHVLSLLDLTLQTSYLPNGGTTFTIVPKP